MILNLNLNKMKYDVFLRYSTYNKEPFSVSKISNNIKNQRNYYSGFNIDKDLNYMKTILNKKNIKKVNLY